ncbi:MAG: MgtC/SapB family protein, partial [Thaumarchaeota archaeon]|nr:MgtC/SapB family protein [Nitrososphaerota archaeon]
MLIAVAVGAIVGLVNEYRKISGARVPMGLRTSIFISLLGYSGALLYQVSGSSAGLAVTIAAAAVVATAVYLARAAVSRSLGATTYVAMILLFFAGSLVGMGLYEYGFALSILLAALSLYKTELLGAISRIRREELLAIVNLLVISALILPMLPDRYIGPYGVLNPYEFWLTVVVVGVIFFAQYVALRVSRRGLLAFTLIGAIVSSTTVALSLVELANRRRELGTSVALNIAVSNMPMALFQVGAVLYVVGGAPALAAALPALLAG